MGHLLNALCFLLATPGGVAVLLVWDVWRASVVTDTGRWYDWVILLVSVLITLVALVITYGFERSKRRRRTK